MKKEYIVIIIVSIFVMISTSIVTSYAVTNYLYDSIDVSFNNTTSGMKSTNVQDAIGELYQIANDYTSIREKIYPVGSIYISVTDDTVAKVQARYGGTWVSVSKGRTLVGVNPDESEFNTVEKTDGEKAHSLTISEMPAHRHTLIRQQWYYADDVNVASTGSIYSWRSGTGTGGATSASWKSNNTNMAQDTYDMLTTGSGTAHNNLPPYITVYIYKRTA